MSQNYFRQFEFNSNFHESNRKTVDFQVNDLDDGLNNAKGKEGGTEPHNNSGGKVDWGKTAQFVFSDDGDDVVAAVSVDISGGGGSEEDGGKRQ